MAAPMPTLSRGVVLAGAGFAATPPAAGVAPGTLEGPDAELVRLCDLYMKRVNANNADVEATKAADELAWNQIDAVKAQIEAIDAVTMIGLLAQAKVAHMLAQNLDGTECSELAADWSALVVKGLLRVCGEAVQ